MLTEQTLAEAITARGTAAGAELRVGSRAELIALRILFSDGSNPPSRYLPRNAVVWDGSFGPDDWELR